MTRYTTYKKYTITFVLKRHYCTQTFIITGKHYFRLPTFSLISQFKFLITMTPNQPLINHFDQSTRIFQHSENIFPASV